MRDGHSHKRIIVGMATCGIAAGARPVMNAFSEELKKRNLKSRMILQVHDELLIEADERELEEVQQILQDKMEHAAELLVPLSVDMHTGKNWYEAK